MQHTKQILTRDMLTEFVYYRTDIDALVFTHGKNQSARAGTLDSRGYPRLYVPALQQTVLLSHAVWLWHTNHLPTHKVKYADGNKQNVTINNLLVNGRTYKDYTWTPDTSKGFWGGHVSLYKRTGKWRARIGAHHIGYFDTKESADAAVANEINSPFTRIR